MFLSLIWQGYLGYTNEQEVHAWCRFWVLDVTGVCHRVSPEPRCRFILFIYSFINAHTAEIGYYFFWRVWLSNAIIFHISPLKYWSKLRLKCIRTQADMVYFSTDVFYLMTFDPQSTATSVLVYLIYTVCCVCAWGRGAHLCLIIHCWSIYFWHISLNVSFT